MGHSRNLGGGGGGVGGGGGGDEILRETFPCLNQTRAGFLLGFDFGHFGFFPTERRGGNDLASGKSR